MVALQQALSGGDPEFLQIDQRTVTGSLLKTPNEIAETHTYSVGRSLEREGLVKILVQPLLRARDTVIGMLSF